MKYIITESQRHTLLMESLSAKLRRRLTFDNMVQKNPEGFGRSKTDEVGRGPSVHGIP